MGWNKLTVFAVLALAACMPPEIVTTVWSGPPARQAIWYATDRAFENGEFGRHWGDRLACGRATVNIAAAGTPVALAPLPKSLACDSEAELAGVVQQIAAEARGATDWDGKPCNRVLLLVHGFNTAFSDALRRAGQVGHDMAWRCPVLAFSWSSEGQVDRYAADVERSSFSTPYLAGLLRALRGAGLKLDVMAHSMGNRVTLAALSGLCPRGAPAPLVEQAILVAADINAELYNDDFETFLRHAGPCAGHITVYASDNDLALLASETLHGGIPRAGRRPLADLRYLTDSKLGRNIDVIDASQAPGGDGFHDYYTQSYEMARDMMWVLDGATPAQRAGAATPYDGGLTCEPLQGQACRYVLTVADNRRPPWQVRMVRQLWPH